MSSTSTSLTLHCTPAPAFRVPTEEVATMFSNHSNRKEVKETAWRTHINSMNFNAVSEPVFILNFEEAEPRFENVTVFSLDYLAILHSEGSYSCRG